MSVHDGCVHGGGAYMAGGMHDRRCVSWGHVWQGACMAGGYAWQGCAYVAAGMATAIDGMHRTGMHSCCMEKIAKIDDEKPALNKQGNST